MPSLFSSRRRASSAQPPVNRSTSSAASAAAGQAFLSREVSVGNLSSAAAAAALRSQTSSPEPVGSIQTKRMVRRGSVSSVGSGSVVGSAARGGVGRGGLQRVNSSGSMTERTFRSPSPSGRKSSQAEREGRTPPVPAIPNGHRRSASVETPQRVMSPTPEGGKRGSSVDRAITPAKSSKRASKRLSNVFEEPPTEEESPTSASKNFSRPMSKDGTDTTAAKSKYTHGTGSWYTQAAGAGNANTTARPRTSDGTSTSSAQGINAPFTNARTKRVASNPSSHLTQANRDSIATSEPSSEADSVMVFDSNSRTFVAKPREQPQMPDSPVKPRTEQVYDANTRSFISREVAEAQPEVPAPPLPRPAKAPVNKKTRPTVSALDTKLEPPPKNPARYSPASESPSSARGTGFLHKQPSVVREDREGEQQAEASTEAPQTVLGKTMAASQRSTTMPSKVYPAPQTTSHQRSTSLDIPHGEQSNRGRNTSLSPSRSTRFSPSPVMGATLHNPPGRDVSPVKSAMKHSPASSMRTHSPLAMNSANGAKGPASDSDAGSDVGSQDGLAPKRKKSVRVSFDDRAPEIAPDPSSRSAPAEEPPSDDDAIMQPRPALPSFGSVRNQRMSPEPAEKVTEMPPDRDAASSDAALGGVLAGSLKGEGKKVGRESSPQEPLPPEVTSREMADYASDASSDTNVPAPTAEPSSDTAMPATRDFASENPSAVDHTENDANNDVPQIALQPPTPGLEDDIKRELADETPEAPEDAMASRRRKRQSREIKLPGGWGDDEDDNATQEPVAPTQPATSLGKDWSKEDSAATQTVTPIASAASAPTSVEPLSDINEDSDDSAEFSDAPEEFDDDGGFASLDAIVESPMITSTPAAKKTDLRNIDEADESPTTRRSDERTSGDRTEQRDWNETTAYWSKLSRQQRQQIEREHMSEDDEPKPAPAAKPKKKKSAGAGAAAPLKPALKQSAPQPIQPTQSAQPASMRKSMRDQPGPTPAEDSGVHMRRSMRSGGSAGGGMMSTMRDRPPQGGQRPQSEHCPEPQGALQKKSMRPASSAGVPASASGAAMRQSMRPASSDSSTRPMPLDSSYPPLPTNRPAQQRQQGRAEPPQVSSRLQKELSKADDSDSESSFRKQRRRNRAASVSTMDSRGGAASMRRSMRGGPPEARPTSPPPRATSPEPQRGSSKWSIRSMSPSGSLFGRNRQPVRASLEQGPRTTLRTQPPAARPASAVVSKGRPGPSSGVASTPTSRFKSRFASDSDDEDEARPARTYRSRFADSDDDDDGPAPMPANLTPVRGIPRRSGQEDGDSTDLDSEAEDPRKASRRRPKQAVPGVPDPADVEKAMAAARRNLGMPETNGTQATTSEGNTLQKGSLRKQPATNDSPDASPRPVKESPAQPALTQKKRGFMGSILRRNRNSQTAVPQTAATSTPNSPAMTAASPQATAGTATPSSPSSPTAGKVLRRTSYQTPATTRTHRGDSDLSTATAPAMYSTLPSNHGKSYIAGNIGGGPGEWPLASPPGAPPVPKIPEHLASNGDEAGSPSSPSYFQQAKEEQTPEPKGRPSTSDGVGENRVRLARTLRPGVGSRTASAQVGSSEGRGGGRVAFVAGDEGSEPGERESVAYSRKTGKKKKFGMLRRAFGLDD